MSGLAVALLQVEPTILNMQIVRPRQARWLIVRFCKIKSARWLTLKKTDSGGQVAILRLLLTLTLSWIGSAYKASQPTLQNEAVCINLQQFYLIQFSVMNVHSHNKPFDTRGKEIIGVDPKDAWREDPRPSCVPVLRLDGRGAWLGERIGVCADKIHRLMSLV